MYCPVVGCNPGLVFFNPASHPLTSTSLSVKRYVSNTCEFPLPFRMTFTDTEAVQTKTERGVQERESTVLFLAYNNINNNAPNL